MRQVTFSTVAREDFRGITLFTLKRFGIAASQQLQDGMRRTLDALAERPLLGRARPELDPPGRSFRYLLLVKRFVLVYEVTDDEICLVRILHGARRLPEELRRDE